MRDHAALTRPWLGPRRVGGVEVLLCCCASELPSPPVVPRLALVSGTSVRAIMTRRGWMRSIDVQMGQTRWAARRTTLKTQH
jgi:hypothetical protein